jgi:hypothetical protein
MYLGQLSKLREAFAASKVTVTLDSRDQEALLDRESDGDATKENDKVVVQDVQLHKQVRWLSRFMTQPPDRSSGTVADSRQLPRHVGRRS